MGLKNEGYSSSQLVRAEAYSSGCAVWWDERGHGTGSLACPYVERSAGVSGPCCVGFFTTYAMYA